MKISSDQIALAVMLFMPAVFVYAILFWKMINGIKYIPEGSDQKQFEGDIKIIVLQRGWVMVGKLERNGSECKLHNASVIRCWGTTKGLGELASDGPKSSTKIDKCNGLVEFDYLTMVCSITCKESVWKNAL